MENIYKQYCEESYDSKGRLKDYKVNCPEDFNFAYDIIDHIAKNEPDRRAMLWCNDEGEEHTFTFADMMDKSNQTANFLASLGIKKGDRVMLILKRHFEYWFSVLALHKLGAIAIPATDQLTAKDIRYRIRAAGVSAIICTPDGTVAEAVEAAGRDCEELQHMIIARGDRKGWISFDRNIAAADTQFARIETKLSDPMLMYFTSGTTGMPKMALHDHSYPIGHLLTARHWHGVDPNGLHLSVADTGWAKAGWGKIYGQWMMAAGLFIYDYTRFHPSDLLRLIEKYSITTFCAPPTIFRFFIKEGIEQYDLSSLQKVTTAGEALNPEVFDRFLEYTGLPITEGFGQSETTLLIANLPGEKLCSGSMGKPSPQYEIALLDEEGNEVGAGEQGEICVRTKNGRPAGLFCGYYRNKEKTDEVWFDGYYHTKDIARMDENGYLWYIGRTDDVIKASGYRIGPFEIESVLMEHPAVMECAVTGAPDPIRGQVVKATITLTKDYKPSDTLVKDLQHFVKKQTAPYKYPRIISFVDTLPKTISGKIIRGKLRGDKVFKAGM